MGHVSNEKYISFLEKLVRFTHEEPYNKENYVALIREICNDYNLAKGVTEFYTTPMMEQRGIGESLCDFDNGKGTRILLRLRIITSAKAVIIGTIYVEANGDEYDETDVQQLDLMFRIIIGFCQSYATDEKSRGIWILRYGRISQLSCFCQIP